MTAKILIVGPRYDYLLKELTNAPDGDVVECGVYQGGTLHGMAQAAPHRRFIGFDTFLGLPSEMWGQDEIHKIGDFADTRFAAVSDLVKGYDVELIRGLFPESAKNVHTSGIALAHVDFDFYASTVEAILWLLPRMVKGGVILFDDYDWKNCPGVRKAIEDCHLPVKGTVKYQVKYVHDSIY